MQLVAKAPYNTSKNIARDFVGFRQKLGLDEVSLKAIILRECRHKQDAHNELMRKLIRLRMIALGLLICSGRTIQTVVQPPRNFARLLQ